MYDCRYKYTTFGIGKQMKRILYHIMGVCGMLMLLSVVSCRSTVSDTKRMVSVTILPQQYFAEQIAGDRFDIRCVVPANSNPEIYDPTPEQMMYIEKSEAYLRVGMLGFEMAWIERLAQNNPDMKIYDISYGVDMIESEHTHRHDDGTVHATHVADPHIWCSPRNARIMAYNIYKAFVELEPTSESYFKSNYDTLVDKIERIDTLLTDILASCGGRAFAIYHPSLTYFARDYNLKQLCIENAGKEKSALAMRRVVEQARDADVRVVFMQKEFSSRQVAVFAQETDAEIVVINPLNYDWDTEMLRIAHAIAGK